MNLRKLFELQRDLDISIALDKNLDPSTLFTDKLIGLLVEISEALNEWKGFKYWRHNTIPNKDELLEELIDSFHLTLSLGIDMNYEQKAIDSIEFRDNDFDLNIKSTVLALFHRVSTFGLTRSVGNYLYMLQTLVDLIQDLGFEWEEVEAAYENKNRINHLRQVEGY
ncbi:dUTP diphosphatase [Halalkalibacter suaedae]|uniref:dUTP diphosphatase n=1 Tax=Halalkalibacter suaedae TaxID=2822140 RepID=A0A941AP61_9BACI|nr:dUTP diphosphatase [Bacillus suaedae]MBP3951147.1 dUTP diphosphatase [Bacillus suaedae]